MIWTNKTFDGWSLTINIELTNVRLPFFQATDGNFNYSIHASSIDLPELDENIFEYIVQSLEHQCLVVHRQKNYEDTIRCDACHRVCSTLARRCLEASSLDSSMMSMIWIQCFQCKIVVHKVDRMRLMDWFAGLVFLEVLWNCRTRRRMDMPVLSR